MNVTFGGTCVLERVLHGFDSRAHSTVMLHCVTLLHDTVVRHLQQLSSLLAAGALLVTVRSDPKVALGSRRLSHEQYSSPNIFAVKRVANSVAVALVSIHEYPERACSSPYLWKTHVGDVGRTMASAREFRASTIEFLIFLRTRGRNTMVETCSWFMVEICGWFYLGHPVRVSTRPEFLMILLKCSAGHEGLRYFVCNARPVDAQIAPARSFRPCRRVSWILSENQDPSDSASPSRRMHGNQNWLGFDAVVIEC